MENSTFKSVAFGGFDKQDVISYIEKTAREAADLQAQLQQEADALRSRVEALTGETETLRSALSAAQAESAQLREELERQRTESGRLREELERSRAAEAELETLRGELERLRPDAEAYAQFRERLGSIECEARKRSADLEAATAASLRQMTECFRTQYRSLTSAFETTAAHVTAELRKVEVNLAQLPRAMDRPEAELQALEAVLRGEKKNP